MNNIFKTIIISLVVFFSALFMGNADVKAERAIDSGTAQCFYSFSYDENKKVQMTIVVQKHTLTTKCDFSPNIVNGFGWSAIYGCTVKETKELKDAIHKDGTSEYQCPKLYIKNNGGATIANGSSTTYAYDYELTTNYNEASTGPFDNSGGPLYLNAHDVDPGNDIQNKDDQFSNNNNSAKDVLNNAVKRWTDQGTVEDIGRWGQYGDGSTDELNAETCAIIGKDIKDMISNALWVIDVAGILLLIIMSAIEFIKAITSSEEDKIKKSFKNTVIRAVACIVLLLLPMIVTWMIEIINENNVQIGDNGLPIIGDNGDPLCKKTN